MKTFLYRQTSLRNGEKDGEFVAGADNYHHNLLLMVIDAVDAAQAARALNTRIINAFDRGDLPTIFQTSQYFPDGKEKSGDRKVGYFFLSLKEMEKGDETRHRDLVERIRFKVTAPEWT